VNASLESNCQTSGELVDITEVRGEMTAAALVLSSPGGCIVKDLKNLQTCRALYLGCRVIRGGIGNERARPGLEIAPSQTVADPVHTGQRSEIGQTSLVQDVVARKP
jgi:hypothetical protein